MQTFQIITLVISSLFGAGGLVAWYKVHKESKVGLSGVEVQDKAATTADWGALNTYWQAEMAAIRTEMTNQRENHKNELAELRAAMNLMQADRRSDAEHIDTLERWIYEGKPPPPPPRRRDLPKS